MDAEGRVTKINYNNATRDSVLDLPLHQVQPFYRALRAYVDIMNRPENVVTYTMQPGQCVFDCAKPQFMPNRFGFRWLMRFFVGNKRKKG